MIATSLEAQPGYVGELCYSGYWEDRIRIRRGAWDLVRGVCLRDWGGQVASFTYPVPLLAEIAQLSTRKPRLIGLRARVHVGSTDTCQEDWCVKIKYAVN